MDITSRAANTYYVLETFDQQKDYVNANQSHLLENTMAPCGHNNATVDLLAVMNEPDNTDPDESGVELRALNATLIDIELAKCSTAQCLSPSWTREKIASELAREIIMNKNPKLIRTKELASNRDLENNRLKELSIIENMRKREENSCSNKYLFTALGVAFLLVVVVIFSVIFQEDEMNDSSSDMGNSTDFGI